MFDRNRVDNATANQLAIPAEVTMSDGEVIVGHFIIASSRAFGEVLNGESPFLEFAPFQRDRRYIAKSAIRTVKLMEVPGGRALDAHRPMQGEFDPYQALGVKRDAEWEEIREAYIKLTKTYHNDRYASVELPGEVRTYLKDMSARVNTAYALLEAPRIQQKRVSTRVEPVYTSRPRA